MTLQYSVVRYNRTATQRNLDEAFANHMRDLDEQIQQATDILTNAQIRKYADIKASTESRLTSNTITKETYRHNDQKVYDEMIANGFKRVDFKVIKGAYGDVFYTRWLDPSFDLEAVTAKALEEAAQFVESGIKSREAKVNDLKPKKAKCIAAYQEQCKFINSNEFLKG